MNNEPMKPLTEGKTRKGGRKEAPTTPRPDTPPPGQSIPKETAVVAKLVLKENTELCGPYECPHCAGHMMLDVTFLDQVNEIVTCPYCKGRITPEDV